MTPDVSWKRTLYESQSQAIEDVETGGVGDCLPI